MSNKLCRFLLLNTISKKRTNSELIGEKSEIWSENWPNKKTQNGRPSVQGKFEENALQRGGLVHIRGPQSEPNIMG